VSSDLFFKFRERERERKRRGREKKILIFCLFSFPLGSRLPRSSRPPSPNQPPHLPERRIRFSGNCHALRVHARLHGAHKARARVGTLRADSLFFLAGERCGFASFFLFFRKKQEKKKCSSLTPLSSPRKLFLKNKTFISSQSSPTSSPPRATPASTTQTRWPTSWFPTWGCRMKGEKCRATGNTSSFGTSEEGRCLTRWSDTTVLFLPPLLLLLLLPLLLLLLLSLLLFLLLLLLLSLWNAPRPLLPGDCCPFY